MSDDEEPRRRLQKPLKGGGDGRAMTELVHPKKKHTPSSKRWLERQLNDPYVAKAKAHGWRSRAAFKLIELDEKFHFLKRGAKVADLGVAPGGWAQVALKQGAAKVVGVDLLPTDPMPGAVFLEGDLTEPAVADAVIAELGGKPDIVLSDMAANTTGHRATDQIKTGALAEAAAEFAMAHLAPGGTFVTKAFQGGVEGELLARLKRAFASVRHAKPPASRSESSEIYLVATGFRGAP